MLSRTRFKAEGRPLVSLMGVRAVVDGTGWIEDSGLEPDLGQRLVARDRSRRSGPVAGDRAGSGTETRNKGGNT